MRRRGRERISETEKVRNKLGRDVSRFLVTALPHHRARAGPLRETGSSSVAELAQRSISLHYRAKKDVFSLSLSLSLSLSR